MKITLVLAGIGIAVLVIVKVLGSTLDAPEYPFLDRGVTGGLAIGAESRAMDTVAVWKEPRYTHTAQDRQELRLGDLRAGDAFRVVNHAGEGPSLWVQIEPKDRPELAGWILSTPDEPVHTSPAK